MTRVRTAPRYDILPTRLDDTETDELAYKIGEATTLDEIGENDFDFFLKTIGISSAAARQRLSKRYATEISNKLAEHLDRLGNGGQKPLADRCLQYAHASRCIGYRSFRPRKRL